MNICITFATLATVLILPAVSMAQENNNKHLRTEHRQQVVEGKLFTVSLPSNPTTGYTWILRTLPSRISLVSSDYHQSDSCKKGMVGCGGEQVFTFRAEKNGHGTIELQYGRPWEQSVDKIWSERIEIAQSVN